MIEQKLKIPPQDLRNISSADFKSFGLQQIAYVRAVDFEGKTGYSIHAADGTPLTVLQDKAQAMALTLQNDLFPCSVH